MRPAHRSLQTAILGAALLVGAMAAGAPATSDPFAPDATLPSDEQLEQAGALVGEVFIDARQIFDTNDPRENGALYQAANRLHLNTRDSVIRQQLLFRSGDRYSARLLAESERILRTARYLYDASVRNRLERLRARLTAV